MMLTPLAPLSDAERHVIECTALALPADLSSRSGSPRVRAELLRRLWLGLPVDPGGERLLPPGPAGLCLVGAEIEGQLNLSELHGTSSDSLPSLRLDACRFVHSPGASPTQPALDLSHTRLKRLSLKGSRFTYVDLSDAVIGGDLDVRDAGPLADDGDCRIKARDVVITGNVKADGLLARVSATSPLPARSRPTVAVDLGGAQIKSSFYMIGGRGVFGGLNLRNAHIGGDVRICGGEFTHDTGAALELQSAHIQGNLRIVPLPGAEKSEVVRFHGDVHMFGCEVNGGVLLEGIQFHPPLDAKSLAQSDGWSALTASSSRIRGIFFLQRNFPAGGGAPLQSTIDMGGQISLAGAKIGGALFLDVLANSPPTSAAETPSEEAAAPPPPATRILGLEQCTVDGSLTILDFPGHARLPGCRVGGDFQFQGHEYLDGLEVQANGMQVSGALVMLLAGARLNMTDASVSQLAFFGKLPRRSPFKAQDVPATAHIDLSRGRFRSNLLFLPHLGGQALLCQLRVDGQLKLCLDEEQDQDLEQYADHLTLLSDYASTFTRVPLYDLWSRDFWRCLSLAETKNARTLSLNLEDGEIGGSLRVNGLVSDGASHAMPIADWGRCRRRALDFLPGFELLEFECIAIDDRPRILAFLRDNDGNGDLYLLDGDSNPLHRVMEKARMRRAGAESVPPEVSTLETANVLEWLRLFCSYVFRRNAIFQIVSSAADAWPLLSWSDWLRVRGKIEPPQIVPTQKGWRISCGLLYGDKLYQADFEVGLDGAVEMTEDRELVDARSLRSTNFGWPFREGFLVRGFAQRDRILRSVFDHGWVTPEESDWRAKVAHVPLLTHVRARQLAISLRGVRASALHDERGAGWFSHGHPSLGAPASLNLDGFAYSRTSESTKARKAETRRASATSHFNESEHQNQGVTMHFDESEKSIESDLAVARISWLGLQYKEDLPTMGEYSPQPWEQIGSVLREQGHFEECSKIFRRKLQIERWLDSAGYGIRFRGRSGGWQLRFMEASSRRWSVADRLQRLVGSFFSWIYAHCFGYGLSSRRAITSCAVMVIIGWHAAEVANTGDFTVFPYRGSPWQSPIELRDIACPALVVDSAAVSTIAMPAGDGSGSDRLVAGIPVLRTAREPSTQASSSCPVVSVAAASNGVEELPCGDQIEPLLYATDTFVPLLDLRQESKCTVSSAPQAGLWRFFKALYAVAGWLLISMTVLTVSGVLRRNIER